MGNEELYQFAPPDEDAGGTETTSSWKVLSVEDDDTYQESLVYGLSGFKVLDRDIQVLTASSATMAAAILAQHDDISVILLDVVMEADDAGLKLIDTVREVMGNNTVRTVLLTGQPGFAARKDVMLRYDIDEYWNKADLNRDALRTVIASNIRSWSYHTELEKARAGLQMVIDAARSIASKQDLSTFSTTLLEEVGRIIGVAKGGIVCARHMEAEELTAGRIIAASGELGKVNAECLEELLQKVPTNDEELERLLKSTIHTKRHHFGQNFTILFFETMEIDDYDYLMVLKSPNRPSSYHINLLYVFSEQVRSGFNNVALLNRVTELAYQDLELHLPNRNWLARELSIMSADERYTSELIILDIKNNVEMKLAVGKNFSLSLLNQLTVSVKSWEPSPNLIARIGTGSFALVYSKQHSPEDAILLQMTEQSLVVDNMEVDIQLNIARFDLELAGDISGDEILSLSEVTINQAVQHNQRLTKFDPELISGIVDRYERLQDLSRALQAKALFLVFQPKVDLSTGQVIGLEALIRWRHEDGQYIPPDQFIPLAEASGLIVSLDEEVLELALDAISQLNTEGYNIPVSCNATVSDLQNADYLNRLASALESGRIEAKQLEIEITESQAMDDYDAIQPILNQLTSLGLGISIDDFGTGYSSLAHITKLRANSLKIDRSFVSAMSDDSDGVHVVEMILRLGERFGFQIIAEGIETDEQRVMLIDKGCKVGQGYLFAKPMPMDELLLWLKSQPVQTT